MAPMKIGHFVRDPWDAGGIQTYVRRVARAQRARGHTVMTLGFAAPPDDEDTPYIQVGGPEALFRSASEEDLDVLHLHQGLSLPEEHPPTIRTMHDNSGSCPSGSRYLKRSASPCDRSYTIPGCLWGRFVDRCGSARPHNIWHEFRHTSRELQHAAKVRTLTVSHFLKEQMAASGGDVEQVHTLLSPAPDVDASFTPPPDDVPPRFLFFGRIVPEKGMDWLLNALQRVAPPWHLDIAGQGYVDRYEQMAADLGLRDRVTFHGWLSTEALNERIRAARAVVFPSVWHEPAGLVTLEAAAHGRAVIAGRAGGIPEYAHEDFAFLADPHDEDALAQRITRLAEDRELAAAMGRRGMRHAQTRFSMDTFLDQLHAHYTAVINRHHEHLAA